MHSAMLRCSNAFVWNPSAARCFGKQFQSGALPINSARSHARFGLIRSKSYSASQPSTFRAERESLDRYDGRTRFKRISKPKENTLSFRNVRLSENLEYTRNQRRKTRREIAGDGEEVSLLMELAKGRGLPEGVNSAVVTKEIQWLKDPKELSLRVARLLDTGKAPLAVAIVRRTESMKMESSAAWNRLLDYCLKKGAPLAAFSFYNDMKKRGRSPTDRTYSIMLKGLCLRSRQAGVKPVDLAYKIYQQLLDPKSGVSASHFHHHPMLEVCGTHHDIDKLWQVLAELPETGPNKPNAQTYTLILLALRDSFDHAVETLSEDQMELRKEKRENLVLDTKRLWADIINQWRKGQLDIDKQLVTTMAHVLSDPMDELNSYNVLALLKQTMDIPILVSKPRVPAMRGSVQGNWEAAVRSGKDRPNYTPWQSLEATSDPIEKREETTPADTPADTPAEELSVAAEEEERYVEDLEDVFEPVAEVNTEDGPAFLIPDNSVLNIILNVCRILTKGTGAGRGYWNLFTLDENGYKLQPDEGNFHEYLRLLRISRSSQLAVDMIRQQMVPAGLVEGKTFHIAMSCCLRDRTNPNVLVNGQALLNLMHENLPLPDPRPLKGFIDLSDALTTNPQWLLGLRGLEDIDQTTTNLTMMGRNLRWALQKAVITSLEPHIDRLYESMEQQLQTSSLSNVSSKAIRDPDTINGFIALDFMVRVRQMLDKLLDSQYEGVLKPADRDWVSPLAIKLRKFSKPEIASKLKNSRLRPMMHHYSIE